MRSIAKGVYKGLIYCKGIEEAQEIKKIIATIKFINKNYNRPC